MRALLVVLLSIHVVGVGSFSSFAGCHGLVDEYPASATHAVLVTVGVFLKCAHKIPGYSRSVRTNPR
eukprot:137467-Pleurochrysis_carterae.AAC.1